MRQMELLDVLFLIVFGYRDGWRGVGGQTTVQVPGGAGHCGVSVVSLRRPPILNLMVKPR